MSRTESPRMRKVNELLKEVVAEVVAELKDPGLGFVTVTEVDTSPDLRHAAVYYSVLGSDDEAAETAAALRRATPHIQGVTGSRIRMKYTPKMVFKVDPSIGEGMKIDRLLHGIEDDHGDRRETR